MEGDGRPERDGTRYIIIYLRASEGDRNKHHTHKCTEGKKKIHVEGESEGERLLRRARKKRRKKRDGLQHGTLLDAVDAR